MANFHERMQQFFEHMRVHGEIGHKLRCEMRPVLPDHPVYGLDEWMVGWNSMFGSNRHRGTIEVGPWPDRGWSRKYFSTRGCCFGRWHHLTRQQKLQHIISGFLVLTVNEGIDTAAVHREFWKIADYRKLNVSFLGGRSYRIFQGEGR